MLVYKVDCLLDQAEAEELAGLLDRRVAELYKEGREGVAEGLYSMLQHIRVQMEQAGG